MPAKKLTPFHVAVPGSPGAQMIKPLRQHPNGQWYVPVRINGKRQPRYFGKDRDAAEKQYLALVASWSTNGQQPDAERDLGHVTVLELVDRFISFQEDRYASADISGKQYENVRQLLGYFTEWAGPYARLAELVDLMGYRRFLNDRLGVERFNRAMGMTRRCLEWGLKRHPPLLDRPLHEDEALRRKPRKLLKRERREHEETHGHAYYEPEECRNLLGFALQRERYDLVAYVLLGLNGGMGAQQISDLPRSAVDLEGGRIDWVRLKIEEICQVTLWPVTIEAIRQATRKHRGKPRDSEAASRLLLTPSGRLLVAPIERKRGDGTILSVTSDDQVAELMKRYEKRLAKPEDRELPEEKRKPMKRQRRGPYGFRRTFDKLADEVPDTNARLRIMGQTFHGQDPSYIRGQLLWERLSVVTDHVHERLFGVKPAGLTLAKLREIVGEPVLLPIKKGWPKGKPKPFQAEVNRQRWARYHAEKAASAASEPSGAGR